MKFLIALLFPILVFATPTSNRQLTGSSIKNGASLLTLPTTADTLIGRVTTDTVTNKSISGSANTLTNIPNSAFSAAAAIDFSKLVAVTGDLSIATNGVSTLATVPIAKGGTNNASLDVTNGGVVYSDGTKLMGSGVGTTGYCLKSGGSGPPTWAGCKKPDFTEYNATGTTAGYVATFTAGGTVSPGCVYTNNGHTFTVIAAVVYPSTQVWMSGTLAPTSSGAETFTYSSGASAGNHCNLDSGGFSANITSTSNQAFAYYVVPTPAPLYLRVVAVGAGGGGGGSGTTTTGGTGGTGTITSFGSTAAIFAKGGTGGAQGAGSAGTGGACSAAGVGTMTGLGVWITGTSGSLPMFLPVTTGWAASMQNGGRSPMGALYGAGGAGGGYNGSNVNAGAGGGSGCYYDVIYGDTGGVIITPTAGANIPYTVGVGGSAGTLGTSGIAGIAGGVGWLGVWAIY